MEKLNSHMYYKDKQGIILFDHLNKDLSYPLDGNDFCYELEDKSLWFRHRNRIIETVIKRICFTNNFADIGGGNGFQIKYLEEKFPDAKFYLIEPNYEGCLNARKRGVKNIYCMSFEEFPFTKNLIGAIGLFDVIEHIENDVEFLDKLSTITPKGTVLYLTTPAYQSLWSDVDQFSGHFRRYTKHSIEKTLIKANWQPCFSSYFFKLLPPLIYTMRCLPFKIRGSRNDEHIKKNEQSHHNGSKIEKILFKLQNQEPNILSKDKINFGSSLIVAAIKK